jgi:arylformamidase
MRGRVGDDEAVDKAMPSVDYRDNSFSRYDSMSAESRARHPGRPDLSYGDGPNQAIDLFVPEAAHPPLLAFIHGGYWHTQDRKRFSFIAEPLLERGVAAALIGYDLAPAVDMDAIVEEIRI